tara:strand:- start:2138 stop:3178 length:1041 start_codon:yes stop_codon:yes gene_type:complete
MAYITFQPKDYFNTKLFTGNGSTNAITGVGFQPDWVWIKDRQSTEHHNFFDAVRGATNRIYSSSTAAQDTASTTLTAFNSDGFTLGSSGAVNASGNNTVSWNWRAGGGQGSSNTDGSINTVYTSVNTTSGVSISQYVGTGSNATVGHGLGVIPQMIMLKNTSASDHWIVYHHKMDSSAPEDKYVRLNQAQAFADFDMWQDTAPTNQVFSISTNGAVNTNGNNFVAYCFAEKKGFSKFGSYLGTSSASGPFIYTGFKPAFVLIKGASTTDWNLYDSKRLGYNGGDAPLFANLTNAEASDYGRIDFLSNGFKIRTTNAQVNNNNTNQIYLAFAEEPIVASNGDPATAR